MTFIAVMQVALFLHLPQEAAPKGPEDNKTLLARLVKGDQKAIAPLVKQGEAMVPTLAEMLPVTPAPDNVYVVIALAEIAESVGPRAKLAAPALCEALRSEDRAVSATAARALGGVGGGGLVGHGYLRRRRARCARCAPRRRGGRRRRRRRASRW